MAKKPGWYSDPQMANTLRFWDGRAWTAETTPGKPKMGIQQTIGITLALSLIVVALVVALFLA